MLDKFKYVWERMTAKVDGSLAMEQTTDWSDIERNRKRLADLRSKNNKSTSTSNLDLAAVRKRITQENEITNTIRMRSNDSLAIGKWFGKEDITQSGSFDTTALHKRIDEVKRSQEEAKEMELENFPDMEDTFLAFSKPEEDLFDDEERITLSGVHYKVDPLEDLDEEYTLPGLPMFAHGEAPEVNELEIASPMENMDQSQIMDFKPAESDEAQRNPTREILASLEARIQANKSKENYWVDSGF